jgi:hypothetical protein
VAVAAQAVHKEQVLTEAVTVVMDQVITEQLLQQIQVQAVAVQVQVSLQVKMVVQALS